MAAGVAEVAEVVEQVEEARVVAQVRWVDVVAVEGVGWEVAAWVVVVRVVVAVVQAGLVGREGAVVVHVVRMQGCKEALLGGAATAVVGAEAVALVVAGAAEARSELAVMAG